MSDPMTILVVEDEPEMQRFLRSSLKANGYRTMEAKSGVEALSLAHANLPDLVLLDLGLPDLDGLRVTEKLRAWSLVPIVVISARGRESDKIEALDAGADDYLTKPFGVGELLARIRVALRHAARAGRPEIDPTITVGELVVDLDRRLVMVANAEVHLTPIEYKLLETMMKSAGKVLTHRQLLREVWGPGHTSQPEYLRVYMQKLRHKLEVDATRPRYIVTEPGVGYRLRAE